MRRQVQDPRAGMHVAYCAHCNKLCYLSRKAAKRHMRRTGIAFDGHMNVYDCPVNGKYLHVGHLADPVIAGEATRSEIYYGHPLTSEDRMTPTTYSSTTPGYDTPASPPIVPKPTRPKVTPANGIAVNHYPQGASAALSAMLADLTTYRYEVNVPVTPALARALIDLNAENNRNHMPTVSDRYGRDMNNGKWREQTGQTIKVDTTGRVIDGLHRLWAIVKSLKTLHFDICLGILPEDMIVIDALKPRTAAHIIKIAGGVDIGRSSGIIRRVLAWESGYPQGVKGSEAATPVEIFERYNRDPQLFDAAARRGADCANHNVGTSLVAGTFYFMLCQQPDNIAVAHEFYDRLVSGLGFDDTNTAIRHLRERMIRRRNDHLSTIEMLALFGRAWNRYNTIVAGRREIVQRLLFMETDLTSDGFPYPIPAHPMNKEIAARFEAAPGE